MGLGVLLHQPDPSKLCEVYVRHGDVYKPWQKHVQIIAHHLWGHGHVLVVDFQFSCNIHGGGGRSSSSILYVAMEIWDLVYSVI